MSQIDYPDWQALLVGQRLPTALLDLDALDENIAAIAQRAAGTPIRLATKSIRCVQVLRHILDSPLPCQGLLCYSAEEAVWLAGQGFDDLLVAYPTINRPTLHAVCDAVRAGAGITLMADCESHLEHLQQLAETTGCILPVAFDLDMSFNLPSLRFGVYRSPLDTVEKVLLLYQRLMQCPALRLDGVMGYEAQIAGVGDAIPGKMLESKVIRHLKQWAIPKISARRKAMVDALEQVGATLRFVNGGGTGSIESTRSESVVTDIAVGSGFYSPVLFDYYRHFRHVPALFFALEVSRQPNPDCVTCLGGGYIASGAIGPGKVPQPWLPEGLQYHPNEGAGEVQTPLFGSAARYLAPGQPVLFRHAKAGELCERFDSLQIVRHGQLVGQWQTYRGDGYCFE
ncbi:amino acid deaminase/aldolase [Chitinivorax sp. B]|uniref:amino acid deaminase/aldolase n=1 Tax=Chitinivorax sp. B TaxID=2502235 RepID=UPI0010F4F401|nr:amino acid deaminase/aldolase [Chitinivorax sp. B]